MGFAQSDFPGKTGILDGGQWRGAGTAVVPADGDDVRTCFRNARGNDADSGAGNEFYADTRARIHGAEVVDQLGGVFDTVNVVMRRWCNPRRPWPSVPEVRGVFAEFLSGASGSPHRVRTLRPTAFRF